MITSTFATAASATQGHKGPMGSIVAAIAAAMARARARHEYRQLLARNDTFSDMGVTRDDVRQALRAGGYRL